MRRLFSKHSSSCVCDMPNILLYNGARFLSHAITLKVLWTAKRNDSRLELWRARVEHAPLQNLHPEQKRGSSHVRIFEIGLTLECERLQKNFPNETIFPRTVHWVRSDFYRCLCNSRELLPTFLNGEIKASCAESIKLATPWRIISGTEAWKG